LLDDVLDRGLSFVLPERGVVQVQPGDVVCHWAVATTAHQEDALLVREWRDRQERRGRQRYHHRSLIHRRQFVERIDGVLGGCLSVRMDDLDVDPIDSASRVYLCY